MRTITCILALSFMLFGALDALTLCDKFKGAKIGDYVVTEQDKNYSILFIKSKTDESVTLEEITVPQDRINPKTTSWQSYIDKGAPDNSSWLLFELSLKDAEVIECYSITQRSWISFDDSEHFLSKFFSLPLSEVPPQERRKIGPPPASDEPDRRAFWYPPLYVAGQKKEKPLFEIRKGRWANDQSLLANSHVEMFFNAQNPSYPFPIWIEVNNGHYGFKIRAFDTGSGLVSQIQRPIPYRAPLIAGNFSLYKESVELPIKCPTYAKSFSITLVDVDNPLLRIDVKHTLVKTDKKELYIIKLDKKQLTPLLQKGHRYRLALVPTGQHHFYIETQEAFLFS